MDDTTLRAGSTGTLFALLPTLVAASLFATTTHAHSPHDDVTAIAAGVATRDGRPLFVIVRNNLLVSLDNGETWKRLVNGLRYSHRINAVAVSYPVPSTVYVTSTNNGVFRSRDGGRSWQMLSVNGDYPPLDLVKVLPGNGDRVLTAGEDSGLYASRDGGESWTKTVSTSNIIALEVASRGQEIVVLAATSHGQLLISSDGFSWQWVRGAASLPADITAIAASPSFANDRLIALGSRRFGVYLAHLHNLDGRPHIEITAEHRGMQVQSIAFSTNFAQDHTIFASVHDGAFRSSDGGETWVSSGAGLLRHNQADAYGVPHFRGLVVSDDYASDRMLFLAGFNGLFRSVDEGRSWRELPTLSRCILTSIDVSPGYASDQTLALATYKRGVFVSRDGGEAWIADRHGMETEGVAGNIYLPRGYEVAFSPNYERDGTLFLATGKGVQKRSSADPAWRPAVLSGHDGWLLALRKRMNFTANRGLAPKLVFDPDYVLNTTMYIGTPEGDLLESRNGGDSFDYISNIGAPIFDLEIVAGASGATTLFAGSRNGAYVSSDGGKHWAKRSAGLDFERWSRQGAAVQVAVSPAFSRDGTAFAGSRKGLYRSTDGGRSWSRLPLGEARESSPVDVVVVSPNFDSDRTVLANVRGDGLFRSDDGGKTFVAVAGELLSQNISLSPMASFPSSAMPLQFSPNYDEDGIIYGVSDRDVLRSADRGAHWEVLPTRPCFDPY